MGAGRRKISKEAAPACSAGGRAGSVVTSMVGLPGNGRQVGAKRRLDEDSRILELRSAYHAIACEPIPPAILALLQPRKWAI